MELIVISAAKLKVMLDRSDMDDFSIDDTNACTAKLALYRLLSEAKKRCGFDATEGRVYVQMYPCRHGGCELFVTKLRDHSNEVQSMLRGSTERTIAEYRKPEIERRYRSGYVIYAFGELQHVLSTCACLLSSGYHGISAAYHDPSGGYFLSLEQETFFAGEHFGRLCHSSMYYYINEHCRLICGDAVPVLGLLG